MLCVKSRLIVLTMTLLIGVPAGVLTAREAKTGRPATIAEAAKVIDLETFPMMPGAKPGGPRRLASLGYTAKGKSRGAYEFQKKTLEERGWKELPGGYLSDMSCSGAFGKDGFTVSVSTSPASGPGTAGLIQVYLTNHGNVDVSKLPVPPDAKLLYSFPAAASFVTDKSVRETSEALRKLLTGQGWEPYGAAGDSLFFKQNAVRITAWSVVAPAQGGKTVIQLSSELLSADLPAPSASLAVSYADTTKALGIDVAMTVDELVAFYRDALGKAGWKPTTDEPVKIEFHKLMIFRNDAKEIVTLTMDKGGDRLRATLEHQTAAELAERIRRVEADEAKRKADAAMQAKMAAEAAAKNRVTVAITLPRAAKEVERTKDELKFKLAAGTARAAALALRADLLKKGWKTDSDSLDPLAGTVVLKQNADLRLIIVYIDTGAVDAEVTISTFGAELEMPTAK